MLPIDDGPVGASACGCFAEGAWHADNAEPCILIDEASTFLYSSSRIGDTFDCGTDVASPPPVPNAVWSSSTLRADCAGEFQLCITHQGRQRQQPQAHGLHRHPTARGGAVPGGGGRAGCLFGDADLSGIGGGGLAVSAIEHEAFIQVDEEGTKAAAAMGVAIADSHGRSIDVDRPFMFFVVDRPTHAVLLLGRVTDPR